jgi:CubicO group peptidase (beta-lactamase class C family)
MVEAAVERVLANLDEQVRNGSLPGLHTVVALRHGEPLLSAYYEGPDERLGIATGAVRFGPDVLHDLRSVTKSVVGLLFGLIAAEHGLDPGALLRDVLATRRDSFGPAAQSLRVRDVLTMTMGLEWDESMSYADPRNAERQMTAAADRVAFVLSRPFAEPAGSRWHYSGGATELLAAIISERSGVALLEFAEQRLFRPLGIERFDWVGDTAGPFAASGLRLTPLGLATIGQLVLREGEWKQRELVPRAWLTESMTSRVTIDGDFGYGYHWYCGAARLGERSVRWNAGLGNGGQRVTILPELDAVVVITGGNYNDFVNGFMVPNRVMRELLPMLAT